MTTLGSYGTQLAFVALLPVLPDTRRIFRCAAIRRALWPCRVRRLTREGRPSHNRVRYELRQLLLAPCVHSCSCVVSLWLQALQ